MSQVKTIKIGIIDSGIDLDLLQATDINIAGGANFKINWEQKQLASVFYNREEIAQWRNNQTALDIADNSGHGTAIASILHSHISRPTEFYIAKILDENTSGSAISLMEAIRWLLNTVRANYINLSLGTDNWQWSAPMSELVKQACAHDCRIFSAAGDVPTLPSELAGVSSVANRQLAQHNPLMVKLDCVAIAESVNIFQNNRWREAELTTSYACPLLLAQDCQYRY